MPRCADGSDIYSDGSSKPGSSVFGDIMTRLGVGFVAGGATVAVGLILQGQKYLLQA